MVTTTTITVLSAPALPGGPQSGCLCLPALPQGSPSKLSYQKALFAIYRMFKGNVSVKITWTCGSLMYIFFYKESFSQMKSPREPQFVRHGKVQLFFWRGEGCCKCYSSASSSLTWLLCSPHPCRDTSNSSGSLHTVLARRSLPLTDKNMKRWFL